MWTYSEDVDIQDGKPGNRSVQRSLPQEQGHEIANGCKVASSEALSVGPAVIRVDLKYDGGVGKGEIATLFINDKKGP